ncbi:MULTISPECIES: acyl-CoA dehydrogenase C-terminal domain-containing protein [unclassified Wenzhouxiangella]|uniref:acyl-CoA dehydrogenase C-terminal domain-containing protein n=1 Tax=unclassified Wenzhouxiangella TaxID=2613841 RepID=UPI000E327E58|nr:MULTISPECIES: acyl-CoA dehydrogenase C-terminal domain-containing protein [unclassified Wenzhouxiangella]RFF27773.1 acyl-CoA dehydrogenase [Wenzhouxiangella sp. 15181]RFP68402.1 acyl-CoA dehydrogenase [Wenzhouxiangella sp. 15190]
MPSYTGPVEDFQFLIKEFLDLETCSDLPSLGDLDNDLIDAVLGEGARFCESALQPLNASGDAAGCRLEGDEVTTPEGFRDAYRTYCENGWPGLTAPPEFGGQGMPHILGIAMSEMITAANTSWGMYAALSHGAWELISARGSEAQKRTWLPKMIAGEWTGTMNLTEPHCGTDLGLVRTRAERRDGGSYSISGTKIWISAGEHDLAENIVHFVLARTPDAPKGTRGLSLFIVPKFLVDEDGELGERNGVTCAGLDHKMGIRGSATCEMVYDKAVGYLFGEEQQGLPLMFSMMNGARLGTGIQGLGLASVAYQNAVEFARERLQGRSLDGARYPDKPADPIIVHPDVRRMLMTSKAFVEGARGLAVYTALQLDIEHNHPDADQRERASHWVALMTPIIKAYFTDMGFEVTSLAMQVHGGAGYIVDTGVEQFMRDARISRIYEGTNGIQALDLVGRKLTAANGEVVKSFFTEVDTLIGACRDDDGMSEFIEPLSEAAERLKKTTAGVYQRMAANPLEAGAASVDYLHLFALTAMAWSWVAQVHAARKAQAAGRLNDAIVENKTHTARFFMQRMLPEALGLVDKIAAGADTLMALDQDAF